MFQKYRVEYILQSILMVLFCLFCLVGGIVLILFYLYSHIFWMATYDISLILQYWFFVSSVVSPLKGLSMRTFDGIFNVSLNRLLTK